MEGGVDENVIDGERGEAGGESAEGSARTNERAHIAQMSREDTVGARGGHAVKIAEQNYRIACRHGAEPFAAGQNLRLQDALCATEAEVTVDEMDGAEIGP